MREQNAAVEFNGGPVPGLSRACPPITYYAPIPLAQILLPNRADSLVS